MSGLCSSTRYAAVRSFIEAFRASLAPCTCPRAPSSFALRSSAGTRLHDARAACTLANQSCAHNDTHTRRNRQRRVGLSGSTQSVRATHSASDGSATRPVENVAVLGGGITGLTSAWYLSEAFPDAKITVYERRERFGGWFDSQRPRQQDGSSLVIEAGPRSLRPSGYPGFVMLGLVEEMGLSSQIIRPKLQSRARYVYYPDYLAEMPGPGKGVIKTVRGLFTEPVFDGFLSGLMRETSIPPRPADVEDESIGSFVQRRLGTKVANNIVSAVFHGIYAGDIWNLSAKSLMGGAWGLERQYGSLVKGTFSRWWNRQQPISALDWTAFTAFIRRLSHKEANVGQLLMENMRTSSITFTNGLQMLPNRLVEMLRTKPNVTLKSSTVIQRISMKSGGKKIEIVDHAGTAKYDHVISTLIPMVLSKLLQLETSSENLKSMMKQAIDPLVEHEKPVTVGVVNAYYPKATRWRPRGFGYLIPQSVPYELNPEAALGVVFDSDVFDLDVTEKGETHHGQPFKGEVLTVMLGGHWWKHMATPSGDELHDAALRVLERHLGIKHKPLSTLATLKHHCIPQYTVGHEKRLANMHDMLLTCFDGRLRVAGSGFTGVSINDCIVAGWRSAENLRGEVGGILKPAQRTGLEQYKYQCPQLEIQQLGFRTTALNLEEVLNWPHWVDSGATVTKEVGFEVFPNR